MLHEYEAISSSQIRIPSRPFYSFPRAAADLRAIREQFASPEEIDEGHDTAPSKRLLKLLPMYRKRLHGPLVTNRIGLAKVRSECPHFDAWLKKVERL